MDYGFKWASGLVFLSSCLISVLPLPGQTPTAQPAKKYGSRLMLHLPGQLDGEMFPESETEFFKDTGGLRMTFVKDADGKVTTLVIHTPGSDYPSRKAP